MQQGRPPQYGGGGSGRSAQGGAGRQPQQMPRTNVPVQEIAFGSSINPKLYSDIAERAAKAVAGEQGRRNQRNRPAQLRRFYDELVALQDKVRGDKGRFDEHLPFVQMLKAKVAYAKGREKVDEQFEALLNQVVDQAADPDKLKQARLFMEAFMAFYKVHGPGEG